jgi:glycosyltransferase involved in cell wall biosynthesis
MDSSNRLRILFVVDGRSPTALNWIAYFVDQGHEVHLVSTFPCAPDLKLTGLHIVPVAFSEAADVLAGGVSPGKPGRAILRKIVPASLRADLRHRFGPLTLSRAARRLSEIVETIQPDLVHAMRIPYEGMVAALANPPVPFLVSVWGNDFTLHAPSTPQMGRYTRRTLLRADALHADCWRDIRLAREWGFPADLPHVVLPGGGGIQLDQFYPPEVPPAQPVVINPRGFRAYVRNDVFFQAIPLVLMQYPEARFLCPAMADEGQALSWASEFGISEQVSLLPAQTRSQMADLYRRAQVVVSPSTHDGTPNTLLEAMACGCFPVAGDIESLREWIAPGVNGFLVDPGDPGALAEAILLAFDQPELRQGIALHNRRLVAERAEYGQVMRSAETFYRSILEKV